MATYLLRVKQMLSCTKQIWLSMSSVDKAPAAQYPLQTMELRVSTGERQAQSFKSEPLTSAGMKSSETSPSLEGPPPSRHHVHHEPCSLHCLLATLWLPSCTTCLMGSAHEPASLQPLPTTTFSGSDPRWGMAAISREAASRSIQDALLAHVSALWWRWECKRDGRTVLGII